MQLQSSAQVLRGVRAFGVLLIALNAVLMVGILGLITAAILLDVHADTSPFLTNALLTPLRTVGLTPFLATPAVTTIYWRIAVRLEHNSQWMRIERFVFRFSLTILISGVTWLLFGLWLDYFGRHF